ncbi:General control protein [Cladophialophora chaetospira]|uniref:General control protein n=1 Tax=Cladophialophora chaetospira TaxID=386627 RepID=A0AA38X6G2_9EURO|nr:General control protein [Cladophialophora chaetospira]
MSNNAFDSMYLPETGFNASPYDLDFDGPHSTFQNSNHGTISPSELLVDDSIVYSAPASTAFPNLSTPDSSFLDSPAMPNSSLNTTPLEDGLLDGQLNFAELDSYAPLFPQNSLDEFTSMSTDPSPYSSGFASVNSAPGQMGRQKSSTGMERQKSSPGRPPNQLAHARKRSDACGISKAPRPRKELPEIQVDSDDDKETAKRKKNTAAARKSRQRKQDNTELLMSENQRFRQYMILQGLDPEDALRD